MATSGRRLHPAAGGSRSGTHFTYACTVWHKTAIWHAGWPIQQDKNAMQQRCVTFFCSPWRLAGAYMMTHSAAGSSLPVVCSKTLCCCCRTHSQVNPPVARQALTLLQAVVVWRVQEDLAFAANDGGVIAALEALVV